MTAESVKNSARGPAPDLPAIVTAPGPEFRSAARRWQGIPGLERAANGRLWATWYTGGEGEGPGNHVVLVTSGDDGRTWTEPVLAVAPPPGGRTFDPCLWHDSLGRLWLFWAQCGAAQWFDGLAGVWCIRTAGSDSAAPAWTAPTRICDGIMMNKPTVLSTGEWLLPAAVWASVKTAAASPEHGRLSHVWCSADQGRTWAWRGSADVSERAFDEHMVVERRDGSLWMLVRTRYGIGESESVDRGVTWSPGRPSGLTGPNSRFFIRRLRSGRILLVNHLRSDARTHLAALLSEDDGRTWLPTNLLLDERLAVSYPDGAEAADGRLFVIYDHNRGDRHSPGRDREILMAVFSEQDVIAGRPVDPRTRLRVVVNRVPEEPPA